MLCSYTPYRCNVCTCALQVSPQDSGEPNDPSVRLLDRYGLQSLHQSPTTSSLTGHVPAVGGRVLTQRSHRSSRRRPSRPVRASSLQVHSCSVTHLHCHMASVPVQHHITEKNRLRTATKKRTLSSGTSALTVCSLLSVRNRRRHGSPRVDKSESHQTTVPEVERARFARSLTAPPRCGPSAAWNVKWFSGETTVFRLHGLRALGTLPVSNTTQAFMPSFTMNQTTPYQARRAAIPPRGYITKILSVPRNTPGSLPFSQGAPRIRRPTSPSTSRVRVARMVISVQMGVTRTPTRTRPFSVKLLI